MSLVEAFAIPTDLVKRLARGATSFDQAIKEWVPIGVSTSAQQRRAIREVIQRAQDHKSREQFGQMFATAVVGLVGFGNPFLRQLEASGLLLREGANHRFDRALSELSTRLQKTKDNRFADFNVRVKTFINLQRLRDSVEAAFPQAPQQLSRRPFRHLKSLYAVANLSFLRHYFRFKGGGRIEVLDYFTSAEDVASAVSTIVALANDIRPLESIDIAFPETGIDVEREFVEVLRYGAAMSTLTEVEKLISVLGYTLTIDVHNRMSIGTLAPPSPELEYALRLGNVRRDMGELSSVLVVARGGEKRISRSVAIQKVVENLGDTLGVIKDAGTARERLVLQVPDAPAWLDMIATFGYYEDVLSMERLSQELEIPMKLDGDESPKLGTSLDFDSFYKAWQILRFINLIDIELLETHGNNEKVVRNSLVRVTSASAHLEMLQTCGLTSDQAQEFYEMMFLDVNRLNHVDIQYRPFLALNSSTFETSEGQKTTPREVIHAPSVVSVANVIPNVQRSHGIRMVQDGAALVSIVEALVQPLVPHTRLNARVRLGEINTDIDVVAFTGTRLYLFECKHSLTPTGAHEMRDLWLDIEKGVSQLERARQILGTRMHDYLNGWFPDLRPDRSLAIEITPCVLCSHRIFSGLQIRGVSIRDLASLALILGDGIVARGALADDGNVHLTRFRLRATDAVALSDLDDYLAPDPKFFRSLKDHMKAFTVVYRLADKLAIARDTYVGQFDDDSWRASLEGIGAQLLDDEVLTVGPLQPPEGSDSGSRSAGRNGSPDGN